MTATEKKCGVCEKNEELNDGVRRVWSRAEDYIVFLDYGIA